MSQHPVGGSAPPRALPARPEPGDAAPNFMLRNQHGETVELGGKAGGPVLLMFYPFAFSRVCGSELREVHRRWEEFRQIGTPVLAISCDSVHTLRAYAQQLGASVDVAEQSGQDQPSLKQQNLSLPSLSLLSDFWPHGEAAHKYGVLNPVTGAPQRVSFLLDESLRVRHQIASENNEPRSLDHTLSLLNGLR